MTIRASGKKKLCKKTHIAPYIASTTWVDFMKSFRGIIVTGPRHLLLYFSVNFDRHAEAAEIDCFSKQSLGDLQWLDELSPLPQLG